MSVLTKPLIILFFLCLVDMIIPLPVVGGILIYVMLQKPPWFMDTVNDIYKKR